VEAQFQTGCTLPQSTGYAKEMELFNAAVLRSRAVIKVAAIIRRQAHKNHLKKASAVIPRLAEHKSSREGPRPGKWLMILLIKT
jgi:hypothetical protein